MKPKVITIVLFLTFGIILFDLAKSTEQSNNSTLLIGTCYTAALASCVFTAWRVLPFALTKFQDLFSKNELSNAEKKLCYNPQMPNLKKFHEFKEKTPVLYCPPWPANPGNISYFDTKYTFTINCNPQDKILLHSNSFIKKLFAFRVMSCGQIHDMMPLLHALIKCENFSFEKIHGFGHSRGGAVWIRALDALLNPEKYTTLWKKLEVVRNHELDFERIERIKLMVQRGKIHLANPWLHAEYPFEKIAEEFLPEIVSYKPVINFTKLLLEIGLTGISNYLFWKEDPGKILLNKFGQNQINFRITIDFAENDSMVGNFYDNELEALANEEDKLEVRKNFNMSRSFFGDSHNNVKKSIKNFIKSIEETPKSGKPVDR